MDREGFLAKSRPSPSTVCAAITFGGLLTLLNLVGDNLNIFCVTYGFPLPYMQFDRFISTTSLFHALAQDDPIRQFWGLTLAYDLVFVILLTTTFTYTVSVWSKTWTPLQDAVFCSVSAAFVLPWLIPFLLPPWSYLRVLGLLAIPIVGLFGMTFGSWMLAEKQLGESWGWTGPIGAFAVIIIGGYVAFPHDPYHNPRPTDVPFLLKSLKSDKPPLRKRALNGLGRLIETDSTLMDCVIAALDDSDRSVRAESHMILDRFGPHAAAAVPKLLEHLGEKADFLYSTTHTLERIGPAARDAIPVLEERLQAAAGNEKLALCEALLAIDPTNRLIHPALIELLPASEGYQKLEICRSLWKSNYSSDLVVPTLIELLDEEFGPIRVDAAEMLGRIGPAAKGAIPRLTEMANAPAPPAPPPAAPEPNPSGMPRPIPMSETEFYPRIRTAAKDALIRINGPLRSSP